MLRLLCVTAHPDDEAGAFGGTLLLYHERGVETSVICLTAGTAARNRGAARTDEELAQLRRAEFAASCKLLNVSHSEVLDFPDSKLDRTDFYQVAGLAGAADARNPSARSAHLRHGRRTDWPRRSRDGGHVRNHGVRVGGPAGSLSRADRAGLATAPRAEALLHDCRLRAV